MKHTKVALSLCSIGMVHLLVGDAPTARTVSDADVTWTEMSPMLVPTTNAAVAVGANGRIYAFGGTHDGWSYCDTVAEYDPANDSWAEKAPMSVARGGLGAASSGGRIYAIGGIPAPTSLSLGLNEAFNPETNTWETKAQMPTPRFNLGMAATDDGKIYVAGGMAYPGQSGGVNTGFWDFLNTLEVYDPTTDTWETKTPMPSYREGTAAVAMNGKIYVIGGETASPLQPSTLVEEYDPATDQWTQRASLHIRREFPAAVAASNGRIYVSGGGEWGPTVEEYDPTADSWRFVSDVPYELAQQGAAAGANGTMYLIGGTSSSGPVSTVLKGTISGTPQDTTPPVITPHVTGALGSGGWYRSDVIVSWTVDDPESVVSSTNGCATTTVATDTAGTTVTCSATSKGGTSSMSVTIARDASGPEISALDVNPGLLWPPNHKMVPVSVSVSALDAFSGHAGCRITAIASSESQNSGDPSAWTITGPLTADLRAERLGNGPGRVYTLSVTCQDAAGNSTTENARVLVAHDRGKGGS